MTLTKNQNKAISFLDGNALINAGAGNGKSSNDIVECESIIYTMHKEIKENFSLTYSDFCLLSWTNAQLGMFESLFAENELSVNIFSNRAFFDSREISDMIDYLTHIQNKIDRMQLPIKNSWTNDKGEVYFVFPIENLTDATGLEKRLSWEEKELISVGFLEEEKTGRANRMFLLQPKATQEDFYTMSKQQQDIDHYSDKSTRGEKSRFTRSSESELLGSTNDSTRSSLSELLVESLPQKDFHQKFAMWTSEVQKVNTNDTELKDTEEDKNNINTADSNSDYDKEIVTYLLRSGLDIKIVAEIIEKLSSWNES